MAQHPFAEKVDEDGALGNGHELVRRDRAAQGVLPAHQSLIAPHGPVGVEEGLIGKGQFVEKDRGAQFALDRAAMPVVAHHVLNEQRRLGAPVSLALIKGEIGLAGQGVETGAALLDEGDSDRGREVHRLLIMPCGFTQLAQQAVCEVDRVDLFIRHHQHGELVAAQAAEQAGGRLAPRDLREMVEGEIAFPMAMGIIDSLEMVEIHQKQKGAGLAVLEKLSVAIVDERRSGQRAGDVVEAEGEGLALGFGHPLRNVRLQSSAE